MAATTRVHCKRCKGHVSVVGEITWEGYCIPCGRVVYEDNVMQMIARSGPNWRKWRRGMAACVGGSLPDELAG